MRKTTIFGLSFAALAASGFIVTASAQPAPDAAPAAAPADTSTPAPAKPAKMHMHHAKPMHMKMSKESGDSAVEDLNAQSLDAAKAGKSFTPPTTPSPKPMEKPMMKHPHMMHHHHMMMKKKAEAAPADASAPAPDAPK